VIRNVALEVAGIPAAIHNACVESQARLPHWPKEIDGERHRRERLVRLQRRDEGHPHCRIGDIAQNAAVQRAHWVRMLRTGLEPSNCLSVTKWFN